jgi:hypothetical protein
VPGGVVGGGVPGVPGGGVPGGVVGGGVPGVPGGGVPGGVVGGGVPGGVVGGGVPGGVVGGDVPGGVVGGSVPGGVVGGSVSVGRTSTVSVNASSGACGTERGLAVSITLVKPASNPVATIPAQITTINRGMRDAPCRFSTRLRL